MLRALAPPSKISSGHGRWSKITYRNAVKKYWFKGSVHLYDYVGRSLTSELLRNGREKRRCGKQ